MAGLSEDYLKDAIEQFRSLRRLADRAIWQITDRDLFAGAGGDSNSVAIIMKHMAGNMRSRWTDFLTSDGEKPDRNRETEFAIQDGDTPDSIRQRWQAGWHCLFQALETLSPDRLGATVVIRSEPHTVVRAINRQLTHYAYHVGQIVFLAKHWAGARWRSLSIPRGKSDDFTAAMRETWTANPDARLGHETRHQEES